MTLELNIPGKKVFVQRDVRETPAATATATSVGLTDPHYLVLQLDADLTNERVLTAGEGVNFTDTGANGTLTINGENATDTNKGIAKFQLSDFSISSGDVSLKAVVVMSVDGDSGTATPALNNLDILGGTGISTAGGANDITITSTHASDNGSSHTDVVSNTSASHAESHNMASHTDDYSAGEGIDISGGNAISAETATATNPGISELATEDEVQTGTDTGRVVTPDTLQSVLSPIGAVLAWLKSFTNTPQTLPTGWVECGGQTLSDADSVYNGQVIPDLNGDNRFLRGNSTSGGTGGNENMAHTHPGGSHVHTLAQEDELSSSGTGAFTAIGASPDTELTSATTGAASNTENRPPFYNVVWIMRIK